jgi:hypothetical protein
MGLFVRFIHNRDKAIENIKTAYCRMLVVFATPSPLVTSLRQKVSRKGIRLPPTSFINVILQSDDMDNRPGRNVVFVKPSRRNSTLFLMGDEFSRRLRRDLPAAVFEGLKIRVDPHAQHKMLTAGVKINGRPIKVNSVVGWVPHVQRPRGRQQESVSPFNNCHIGVVKGFYYMVKEKVDEDFREKVLLIEVEKLKVTGRQRSLYILKTPFGEDGEGPSPQVSTQLVDADSIVSKVKLVRHMDTSESSLICGIVMWNVR